jgi:four helix bundle suffix protein
MLNHSETNRSGVSPHLTTPHGGYRDLRYYQMTEIVFDATVVFCDPFIDRRSRTHDQMVQVTRSGKQNHVFGVTEGSMASGTSKKTEFKLIGVAWASLEGLICLIHQANPLLDRQLRALEKEFLEEGGFTERLYHVRSQMRNRGRKI